MTTNTFICTNMKKKCFMYVSSLMKPTKIIKTAAKFKKCSHKKAAVKQRNEKLLCSTKQTFYSLLCESQSLSLCAFTSPASLVLLHWFSFKSVRSHKAFATFAVKQMTVYKREISHRGLFALNTAEQ